MFIPKAFIFDLDGTLVDSEPYHFTAYKKVIEKHGGSLSKEDFIEFWLTRAKGMTNTLQEQNLKIDPMKARLEKQEVFLKMTGKSISPMPGAKKILEFCEENDIPRAIASGSRTEEIVRTLQLSGLDKYFSVLYGRDRVEKNKPYPDLFIASAEELGVPIPQCLAFENTPMGIQAAKNAGMKCIAIPSEFTRHLDLSEADIILNSLENFTPEIFKKLCHS